MISDYTRRRIAQIVEGKGTTIKGSVRLQNDQVVGVKLKQLIKTIKEEEYLYKDAEITNIEIDYVQNRGREDDYVSIAFVADFSYLVPQYNLHMYLKEEVTDA